MFHDANGSVLDKLIANFLRMVLFIILAGYLLVITKLFEVIGILGVVIIWTLFQQSRHSVRNVSSSYAIAVLFDLIELPQTSIRFIRKLPSRIKELSFHSMHRMQRLRLNASTVTISLVVIVIATVVWMRLYVGVTDPTPKMSDGDVLLAWIKYINLRYLMHDGIYPQGYFFYMAVLGKFSVINPLYILNFTGPLDSVMIILTMYYFVFKLTQSKLAALVSITLYGILGQNLLFQEWVRQSGSETQEFGFIFALPAMYFLHRYLDTKNWTDFWVAFAGLCDAGLVHPLSYVLAVVGTLSVLISYLFSKGKNVLPQIPVLLLGGIVSGGLALMPYGLAFIYRIPPNTAGQSFLTAQVTVPSTTTTNNTINFFSNFISQLPSFTVWDFFAVAFILLMFIYSFIAWIRNRPNVIWGITSVYGLIIYIIYEFGAVITKSFVLSTRMIDVWAIVQAVVIGIGIAFIIQKIRLAQRRPWIEGLGAFAVVSTSFYSAPPSPIIPYDVQWKSDVNAYLEINQTYGQLGYMIVSPDFEYALVLGQGYHMLVSDFVKQFSPTLPPLTLRGHKKIDNNIASYVFLYVYKHIFEIPKTSGLYYDYASEYHSEIIDNKNLKVWIQEFNGAHPGQIHEFFNDKNLIVYKIEVK